MGYFKLVINGWPDLLVEPADAKARLDVLLADAEGIQRLPLTSDAEMRAAIDAVITWRERARTTFLETFEPAAAERFHTGVAENVLASFSPTAEKVAAAHGILLDDISHVIVLGIWAGSTDGKPMSMSPDEMIIQMKAKHQGSAAAQAFPVATETQSGDARPGLGVIGWARRATAFAIHVTFWGHVGGWWHLADVYRRVTAFVPFVVGIPIASIMTLLAVGWASYLTRLKIGWMFLLPFYIVYPAIRQPCCDADERGGARSASSPSAQAVVAPLGHLVRRTPKR